MGQVDGHMKTTLNITSAVKKPHLDASEVTIQHVFSPSGYFVCFC